MNKKIIFPFAIIILIIVSAVAFIDDQFLQSSKEESRDLVLVNQYFNKSFLFDVYLPLDEISSEDSKIILQSSNAFIKLIAENDETYKQLSPRTDSKTIVIIPMFTAMAYSENGFYDFYNGVCDETCLTIKIKSDLKLTHNSSNLGAQALRLLGYDWTTDLKVHKNPKMLEDYDRVILLHNEYITQEMFDAITAHPNVIYLYPNALYAKILVNNEDESITLVRGHNFPEPDIKNGFDWEFDNTHPYEYDIGCDDWEFYRINNGFMLNCYPENAVIQSKELLNTIRDIGLT